LALRSEDVEWVDAPPEAAWRAANELLDRIGATEEMVRGMARLPLHPRLAAIVLEANRHNAGEAGCQTAALLSVGMRGASPKDGRSLLDVLEQPLDGQARRVYQQLVRQMRPKPKSQDDAGLLHGVLRGYPDRVRRLRDGRLIVALDMEERKDRAEPLLRLYAAIEPDWLIDTFADQIEERETLEWNRTAERVEQVSAMYFGDVLLDESRGAPKDLQAAARLLAIKAMETGLHRFTDVEELEALRHRVAFASQHGTIAPLDDLAIEAAFASYAEGKRSFVELGKEGFTEYLLASMDPQQRQLLEEIAPIRIRLASGRQAKVRYEPGKAPVVASRLQDFFGMRVTPAAARGRVPMVIELLAPNHRPVQTTTDLAGFWTKWYPQVRRELMRRYPRHAWPEDPYQIEA
jgi:ATP-dependent helicase HrpB